MNEQNWKKILEEDNRENWQWYARWLRDEQENESKARAVEWMIFENREPFFHNGSRTYDWYVFEKYDDSYTKQSKIKQKLHDHIKGYKLFVGTVWYGFNPEDWKGFDTKLAAKLALIDAYELYKSTNPDLDAAPGE
jgi:hypothetical protein